MKETKCGHHLRRHALLPPFVANRISISNKSIYIKEESAMNTYPNQKTVTVHKPKYEQDFTQVGKSEWMEAFANLTPSAFGLYLYCCGNMDGYRFGLSSRAIQVALNYSDSSYRRAVEDLLTAGYFIQKSSEKTLHFYTTPQPTTYIPKPKKSKKAASPADAAPIFEETSVEDPTLEDPDTPSLSLSFSSSSLFSFCRASSASSPALMLFASSAILSRLFR